jgi:hypothetical protein
MLAHDNAPELEGLVADMSVMHTPAPQRSSGGLRGNAQESTLMGPPMTVNLLGDGNRSRRDIPREVTLNTGQMALSYTPGSSGKRFNIFVASAQYEGFSSYCFQFIRQGKSYCTACNYTTSHHHALVKIIKPGEIYVSKSSTTAFVTPSITKSVIDSDVLSVRRELLLTLLEWNEKFLIATAALDGAPVWMAAMEIHEEFFCTKAFNFKTPAKRKRDMDDGKSPVLSLLDVSLYSPFFKHNKR